MPDGRVVGGVHDLEPTQHARQRQPARNRLRDNHEVGLDVAVLDREQLPGAAEARLHLVDDEDYAVRVAEAADAGHELGRADDEAAFALQRLDDDCRYLLGSHLRQEGAFQRSERLTHGRSTVVIRERGL